MILMATLYITTPKGDTAYFNTYQSLEPKTRGIYPAPGFPVSYIPM